MRRVWIFLPLLLVLWLPLDGCQAPPSGGGDEVIEIGALVACGTPQIAALTQGKHPQTYAVSLWHQRASLPPCPAKVDLVVYPSYDAHPVWVARNVGAQSVHMVPRRYLVTPGIRVCLGIYSNSPPLSDPSAERHIVNGQVRYDTCAANIRDSVLAGRSTGRSGDGFRVVAVVRGG